MKSDQSTMSWCKSCNGNVEAELAYTIENLGGLEIAVLAGSSISVPH